MALTLEEFLLLSRRIDQLEEGTPQEGDFSVYRDMINSKTKKFKLPISTITGNFEWTSTKAADGDYDIDVVVTYGGKWWKSAVNNNTSVPGVDDNWEEQSRSSSGFVRWQAGIFPDDEVFVWEIVGSAAYLFRLKNETRPYISSDFEDELEDGDWELFGKLQAIPCDTTVSGVLTLSFLNLDSMFLYGTEDIDEDKDVTFESTPEAGLMTFRFSINDVAKLTLPVGTTLSNPYNAEYNSGTREWRAATAGRYEMYVTTMFIDDADEYLVRIEGPFY